LQGSDHRTGDVLLWSVAEHPLEIECQWAVLDEIYETVQEAVRRLSRGGVEVGGVLFGRRDEDLIRVLAWRPISCDHTRGPAFVLSNDDQQGLMLLLEQAQSDPQLQVLDPVGWFVSHTRPGLRMTEDDIDLFNRFFPEPWQVTLVVHPQRNKGARGGFFVREKDGRIQSSAPYGEFPMEGARALAVSPRPGLLARRGEEPGEEPGSPEAGGRLARLAWVAVALLVCALALYAIPKFRQPPAPDGLQLRIVDVKGQLRVEWDRNSRAVQRAESATLFIDDGGMLPPVHLDGDATRRGSVTYARLSEDVIVRLEVNRDNLPPLREQARYVGPPLPKYESRELRDAREHTRQLDAEAGEARKEIAAEADRAKELKKEIRKAARQEGRKRK
jgi:proteasome lid subunit RPN8/RPN11